MNPPCQLFLHHMPGDEPCAICGRLAKEHPNYLGPEWLKNVLEHTAKELRRTIEEAKHRVRSPGMVHISDITIVQIADKLAEQAKEISELREKIEELTRVH